MNTHSKLIVAVVAVTLPLLLTSSASALAIIPSPFYDIAIGAPVTSTTSNTAFGAPFDNLTDGNRNGVYLGGDPDNSLAHTDNTNPNQDLIVTLGAAASVRRIILFNRTDCCDLRINPFQIDVFSDVNNGTLTYSTGVVNPFINDITQTVSGEVANGMIFDFAPVTGKVFRITQAAAEFMNLAELEVYTIPEPSSAVLGLIGCAALGAFRRRRTAA